MFGETFANNGHCELGAVKDGLKLLRGRLPHAQECIYAFGETLSDLIPCEAGAQDLLRLADQVLSDVQLGKDMDSPLGRCAIRLGDADYVALRNAFPTMLTGAGAEPGLVLEVKRLY